VPIIRWLLLEHLPGGWDVQVQVAHVRAIPLQERVRDALAKYPCELLFVHRDAEGASPKKRHAEVATAVGLLERPIRYVAVIPVRMTEAWLLADERALRAAADNPRGSTDLGLPPARSLERLADPKAILEQALRTASEARGRHLSRFRRDINRRVQRVAELADPRLLRALPSFCKLEADVQGATSTLPSLTLPRR
jgi:hypothetical protein